MRSRAERTDLTVLPYRCGADCIGFKLSQRSAASTGKLSAPSAEYSHSRRGVTLTSHANECTNSTPNGPRRLSRFLYSSSCRRQSAASRIARAAGASSKNCKTALVPSYAIDRNRLTAARSDVTCAGSLAVKGVGVSRAAAEEFDLTSVPGMHQIGSMSGRWRLPSVECA